MDRLGEKKGGEGRTESRRNTEALPVRLCRPARGDAWALEAVKEEKATKVNTGFPQKVCRHPCGWKRREDSRVWTSSCVGCSGRGDACFAPACDLGVTP